MRKILASFLLFAASEAAFAFDYVCAVTLNPDASAFGTMSVKFSTSTDPLCTAQFTQRLVCGPNASSFGCQQTPVAETPLMHLFDALKEAMTYQMPVVVAGAPCKIGPGSCTGNLTFIRP